MSKRKFGKITVVYLDENDKKRTAAVQLEKEDYYRAIEAHEKGLYVENKAPDESISESINAALNLGECPQGLPLDIRNCRKITIHP